MSQFRIKNIDNGLPDQWVFRSNDDGAALGDDIVAEDPNDLARAIIDTQNELLKASVYSPGNLIDPNSGALERIKLLEDNVGSISLQDAYDNGNFINPDPGRNIILGAGGVVEIDSSGNLLFNPSTMRIYSGAQQLDFSHNSITSSTTSITVGSLSPSNSLTLLGGDELFFNDSNLSGVVTLSESGVSSLATTSNSIVGAINEINGGFTSASLQQIYNQSSPPRITTTNSGGKVIIQNGTGNSFVPALEIQGNTDTIGTTKSNSLEVGPIGSPAATIQSSGRIESNNVIKSSSRVETPRVETTIGALTLVDTLGSADLTSVSDPSLNTTKQTIFGSINEVNALANQNASGLAAFDVQHDSVNGMHEIITTQSSGGNESTKRISVRDSGGTNRFTVDGNGLIEASGLLLPSYNLLNELSANETHRNDDGTSHSAVASHFAASNPHDTVKYINTDGSPQLSGDVTFTEGVGITLNQSGQNIEISATQGNTLQGVYDSQANGILQVANGKNLIIENGSGNDIAHFLQSSVEFHQDLIVRNSANIHALNSLTLDSTGILNIESTTSDVNITSTGGFVNIEGVNFAPTAGGSLRSYSPNNLVDAFNEVLDQRYFSGTTLSPTLNNTNFTLSKGTPVFLQPISEDVWVPISSAKVAGPDRFVKTVWGLLDEDVASGDQVRIKHYGIMEADIGQMDPTFDGQFQTGDTLYMSKPSEAKIEISNISNLADGDTITVDVGGAAIQYTARSIGADPSLGEFNINGDPDQNINEYLTSENIAETISNNVYQASNGAINLKAFSDGKHASADLVFTGTMSAGETFEIQTGLLSVIGASSVVFTAVAPGNKTQDEEFEVGLTPSQTAKNLRESIEATRVALAGGSVGHECLSEVSGDVITIRYGNVGVGGNSLPLVTNSTDLTVPPTLNGGYSYVAVYDLLKGATGKTLATSNSSAINTEDFSPEESESHFIAERRLLGEGREKEEKESFIKVGKVLGLNAPNTIIQLGIEDGYVD